MCSCFYVLFVCLFSCLFVFVWHSAWWNYSFGDIFNSHWCHLFCGNWWKLKINEAIFVYSENSSSEPLTLCCPSPWVPAKVRHWFPEATYMLISSAVAALTLQVLTWRKGLMNVTLRCSGKSHPSLMTPSFPPNSKEAKPNIYCIITLIIDLFHCPWTDLWEIVKLSFYVQVPLDVSGDQCCSVKHKVPLYSSQNDL